jgi:hypothetical protein
LRLLRGLVWEGDTVRHGRSVKPAEKGVVEGTYLAEGSVSAFDARDLVLVLVRLTSSIGQEH